MAPRAILKGLNTRPKQPKPITPLQKQLVEQRAKDLHQAEVSNAQFLRRLKRERSPTPDNELPIDPLDVLNFPPNNEPPEDAEEEVGQDPEARDEAYVINSNHFMPAHPPPSEPDADAAEDDPVVTALRYEQRLAYRLCHEERWTWQHALMLPTFLRCRLETSNWGKTDRWNHDFQQRCNCACKTEREVDLVDLTSRRRVKISFCKYCDPSDMVRLLLMGYVGASPVRPETAFSVRLLVHHHSQWLNCAVSTQGFCKGLDKVLDSQGEPLILTASLEPRQWHQPFTSAIDAYRAILLQIQTLENQKLQLSELGILASNCPKCFGPPVGITTPDEADVHVCLDGNYQHRRHAAASVEIPGYKPAQPDLFLDPAEVNCMARKLANSQPNDASFINKQTIKYQAELIQAQATLDRLLQAKPAHTFEYFDAQWERQRQLQLAAISVRAKERRERLTVLLELEEQLLEAWSKMNAVNPQAAPIRTNEQREELLNLPMSLANLEAKVQEVAEGLGFAELLNVQHGSAARIKAVITVQVALALLYEAKFDVLQQEADAVNRTGWYNQNFRPRPRLHEPSFDEVLGMDIEDPFWNEGALSHPDEPWASCQSTKAGIVAFRSKRSCEEEMRRMGREVRQMMLWGIDHQLRVDNTKPNGPNRFVEWDSIYTGLAKRSCRLWKRWDRWVLDVLLSTSKYVEGSAALDINIKEKWQGLMRRTEGDWAVLVGAVVYFVNEENEEDEIDYEVEYEYEYEQQ
ncbi:hypothetical protein DFH28DRAFT_1079978 [Melampsora americana]|nr:hypothetical protein DFH28DRAFT_1079978 [Melampsora americana]